MAIERTGRGPEAPYPPTTEDSEHGSAVREIVDHLISQALRDGASEIRVEPELTMVRIRFRIDEYLVHVTDYPVAYAPGMVSRIRSLPQAGVAMHGFRREGCGIGVDRMAAYRLKTSFYPTVHGEQAVVRVLGHDKRYPGLNETGMSRTTKDTLVHALSRPGGNVVLVAGPAGSGKATTLHAAVAQLNDDTGRAVSHEDVAGHAAGGHATPAIAHRRRQPGWSSPCEQRLREPVIALIGGIHDRLSADRVFTSAMTGHTVLSTLQAEDSIDALLRLRGMNVDTFLIASTVTAILAQRLVRKPCPKCSADHIPTAIETRALSVSPAELSMYTLTKGQGCPHCYDTGYRGRTGVFELLIINESIRQGILEGQSADALRRRAFETPGFVCLQEDGLAKALRGETTLSEVAAECPHVCAARPLARFLGMYL